MDIVLYVIVIIAALVISGIAVNFYLNIKDTTVKKRVSIVFLIVLILVIILIIALLCNFFYLLKQVQPL